MPLTFLAMLVSTMAIAGVPLFAGFFSKDMIVASAFQKYTASHSGAALFAAIALPAAAALTAFYMFRLIFLTFTGAYRGHDNPNAHHAHGDDHGEVDDAHGHGDHGHGHAHVPHESPRTIVVAILMLAALGFLGGNFWLVGTGNGDWFNKSVSLERLYGLEEVVEKIPHLHLEHLTQEAYHKEHAGEPVEGLSMAVEDELHALHASHTWAPIISTLVAGLGILLAACLYLWKLASPERITSRLGLLYTTVRDKYYIDEIVNGTVIRFVAVSAKAWKAFDEMVVDGIVNLHGYVYKRLGFAAAWIDLRIVDGVVNYLALTSQAFGAIARLVQTGRIQQYAAMAVGGAVLAAAWLILN
jgi:NADH-quinone oxidoreductase subunit L